MPPKVVVWGVHEMGENCGEREGGPDDNFSKLQSEGGLTPDLKK
jgi:hypothetical protein